MNGWKIENKFQYTEENERQEFGEEAAFLD